MAKKERFLSDAAKDQSAKDFISEGRKPERVQTEPYGMLNSRQPKSLIKWMKIYSAMHDISMRQLIEDALIEHKRKLSK